MCVYNFSGVIGSLSGRAEPTVFTPPDVRSTPKASKINFQSCCSLTSLGMCLSHLLPNTDDVSGTAGGEKD